MVFTLFEEKKYDKRENWTIFINNLALFSLFTGFIRNTNTIFTITAEIHARSLANFYCQYADRHMNLKFMRRVSEREPAIAS